MPEIAEFKEIRNKITGCIANPHGILRELDQAEIVEIVRDNFQRTGVKLPKRLKEMLAEKFHFSEKTVERIIYECDQL